MWYDKLPYLVCGVGPRTLELTVETRIPIVVNDTVHTFYSLVVFSGRFSFICERITEVVYLCTLLNDPNSR